MENMKKLSPEEIEMINGGLIVDCGNGTYCLVDDNDGTVTASSNSLGWIQFGADMEKRSKTIISAEEYKKRFGVDIQP